MFKTGDAVKSCPAVDPLSGLVVVGSHDGQVYALNPQVGVEHELMQKELEGLENCWLLGSSEVISGGVCVQIQQCVWKRHCGGGAVFSSPHLHSSRRRVYVASLGGRLLCLNLVSQGQCADRDRN